MKSCVWVRGILCGLGIVSPFVLSGCETKKTPLVGERIPVSALQSGVLRASQTTHPLQALSSPVKGDSWLQPDRVASHDKGHVAFEPLAGETLQVITSTGLSGSSDAARLLETPVLTKEAVFLLDDRGCVVKADRKTGDALFRVSVMPDGKEGEAALGGGCAVHQEGSESTVFVATPYGELVAVNGETGAILWRQPLQSPARCAPTLAQDRLYVATLQNQLQVFDLKGQLLWTHGGMPEMLGILGVAAPAVSNDVVVVTYTSGEVFALRADTGSMLWSDIVSGPRRLGEAQSVPHVRANPVIHGDSVYVSSYSGQLVAFNLHNGHRLWEVPAATLFTPVIEGETLFVLTTTQEIAALDRTSGHVRWVHPLASLKLSSAESASLTWAGPLLAGGRLYLLSERGDVVAFDPLRGTPVTSVPAVYLDDSFSLPLLAVEGHLYALSASGRLYTIR